MGFRKVKDAFSEVLNANSACKSIIKVSDIIAAVIALLSLIAAFDISYGGFINALFPYLVFAAAMFALASKGRFGLLLLTASQTVTAFIRIIRWMVIYTSFGWDAFFSFIFWGVMTFFVVSAISKDGIGESMLIDSLKSISKPKGPVRVCQACGAAEKDSASKFCKNCGAQLPELFTAPPVPAVQPAPEAEAAEAAQPQASVTKACPNCGKIADKDAGFCTVCGTKLN